MALGRYAIVVNGIVNTVSIWDPVAAPGWLPVAGTAVALSGQQLLDAVPGALYNSVNGVFTPPMQQLAYVKALKQAALDTFADANADIMKFVRNGTVKTVTGTGAGNFIASCTNNYRTIRDNIAAALTVSAVLAIDITAGWPANP